MDGSITAGLPKRFQICVALFALTSLLTTYRSASQQPTTEDGVAEHEYAIAAPELDHLNHVMAAEMKRLTHGGDVPQSPEVAKHLNGSLAKRIDLGDLRIPLHTRFIESQRRALVAGISFAKASTSEHCQRPFLRGDQLLDKQLRAKVLAALHCHERELDRFQSGMRQAHQQYEATLFELKLPPFTLQKMVLEAEQSAISDDHELSRDFARQQRSLHAYIDLLSYLDTHAAHASYVNNELVFDDPAELNRFHELAVGARIESMNLPQ